MKHYGWLVVGCVAIALNFTLGANAQTARGPLLPLQGEALFDEDAPPPIDVMEGRSGMPPFRIAPPANFAEQPKTATFTIQYLNAGEVNYYGDVCVGWPDAAKAAFTYAANVWGSMLNSSVPIKISACWANMGTGGILGHGGARSYYKDFSGAPQSGTYYPVATANALAGTDLNGGSVEEIVIAYNAQFTSWYYGTDGNCPGSKIDFAQVIMHEMCHGLGFIGSMSASGSTASWGLSGYPTIYDRFTENGSGTKLITYSSGSSALYNQLVSGSVYFNAANANSANGGSKVKLYAPNPWKPGSSYAHLDEIFNGTPNTMMTYSVDYGESVHNPGPITLGLMKDVGWNSSTPPPPPPPPPIQPGNPILTDYDGDYYADLTMERTDGTWRLLMSRSGYRYYAFNSGASGSRFVPQPADFDGDRYGDPTVYDSYTGYWYFMSSRYGYQWWHVVRPWYVSGGTSACGDFDGDRRADPIAYSSGTWFIMASRYGWDGHYYKITGWGGSSYIPLCADFDGDRYGDPMAYDTSTGYWWILSSRYDYNRYYKTWFGAPGFTPITGDFDGDRYSDLAVYNKTTGMWYILLSTSGDKNYISGLWDGSAR